MRVTVHLLLFEQLPVGPQRQQGPAIPVHVVLQIKNTREAGPRRFVFLPRPIRILRAHEVFDATDQRRTMWITKSAKPHHRPGCLRSRAWALAFEHRIVVSIATLAPATIFVL